jgi:acetyl esterase/lipase
MLITLLLCLLAIVASAKSKYPIHEDFAKLSAMSAPLGRCLLGVGNGLLTIMPKGMCSNKQMSIKRVEIPTSQGEKSVKAWVVTPRAHNNKAILMLHGGGFVFKGAPYHYKPAKEYAQRTNSVVVMIDYSTAHNNAYGTTLRECCAAWQWLVESSAALGVDSSKISIVGDSAGGFLAVKTALWAMSEGVQQPEKVMLVYPVIDNSMRTESMAQFTDTPIWNAKLNAKMWSYYLQGESEESLLDIDAEVLRQMPMIYVETAEFDCLRDEGEIFAQRLREAGVSTTYIATKGTMHGFDIVQKSDITKAQVEARCCWLK